MQIGMKSNLIHSTTIYYLTIEVELLLIQSDENIIIVTQNSHRTAYGEKMKKNSAREFFFSKQTTKEMYLGNWHIFHTTMSRILHKDSK